jgi:FKBP-type peptidyl-prolyl cis-trans isomerase
MRRLSILGFSALFLACASPVLNAEEVQLETEDQKVLYAVGQALSQSVAMLEFTPEEMKFIAAGLTDGATGAEAKVDMQVYGPQIQATMGSRATAMAQKEKEAGTAFCDAQAALEGAKRTESGLVFKSLAAGDGAMPSMTDTVRINYHGTLRDGDVFDTTRGGEPAQFSLGGVIPCFSEGLTLMKVGGKAQLTCPADIAYGERGSPPKIRPNAAISFEIELLEIVVAAVPTPTPTP